MPLYIALIAGSVSILANSMTSHNAAVTFLPALSISLDWVHFMAVSIWVGGLFYISLGSPPLSAQCEATTYHSNTYMTGRAKFEKDLIHTAGYTADSEDPQILSAVNMALGKWVGVKAIYYNFPNGTVKLEQWVDDSTDNINSPGNKWHKVLDFTDNGQWGGGQPNCGGTPSTIIT